MLPGLVIANQSSSCSIILLFHCCHKFKPNFFCDATFIQTKVFRYNQSWAVEIDCVAFHQCFAWYIFFVSSSSLKVTVTSLLIRWSNDEGLICCDHRAACSRALSLSGSPLYFISLFCASVSPCRLLSVFPVIWCGDARYWRIKDSHLWSVSSPSDEAGGETRSSTCISARGSERGREGRGETRRVSQGDADGLWKRLVKI